MKKIIFFLFSFSVIHAFSQDSSKVYQVHFNNIDNTDMNLSAFQGKQILVVEFAASEPDRKQLLSLDSLYKIRSSTLQIISIPVFNSDTSIKKNSLVKLLRDTLRLSFIISDIGHAKKSSNSNQHGLLKWITHVSSNKHFDNDIVEDGQMFMISKTGILYASLGRLTSLNGTTMKNVLDNQPSGN